MLAFTTTNTELKYQGSAKIAGTSSCSNTRTGNLINRLLIVSMVISLGSYVNYLLLCHNFLKDFFYIKLRRKNSSIY
jgi:hypothetical protein